MFGKKYMKFDLGFFILKNQALGPDPYPDPHWFSKPWIRIRMKWMRIRNPDWELVNRRWEITSSCGSGTQDLSL